MKRVYMQWIGELKGDVKPPLKDTVRKDPLWFPEEAPEGAELFATEVFEEEVEFLRGVWKGKIRIGPIDTVVGVNFKFKGKIEFWVAEDGAE